MSDPDHIPAPADHAPRKCTAQHGDAFVVYEPENGDAWLQSKHTVEVQQ